MKTEQPLFKTRDYVVTPFRIRADSAKVAGIASFPFGQHLLPSFFQFRPCLFAQWFWHGAWREAST